MSLAFYMDEHVPRSITSGLRLRSIDVLTVQEDGRTDFPVGVRVASALAAAYLR